MFSTTRYAREDRKRAKRRLLNMVTWAWPEDEGVIREKYDGWQQSFEIQGPDPESMMPAMINALHRRANDILKDFGEGWCSHWEVSCVPLENYPDSDVPAEERYKLWPNDAAYLLDEEDRERFESSGQHVRLRYFVTLSWRIPPDLSGLFETIFVKGYRGRLRSQRERHYATFRRHVDEFVSRMGRQVHIRPLTTDETKEYLHSCVSWKPWKVSRSIVHGRIDEELVDCGLFGDFEPRLDHKPLRVWEIGRFNPTTAPAMFHALTALGRPFRFVVRFKHYGREESERKLDRIESGWSFLRKKPTEYVAAAFLGGQPDLPGAMDNDTAIDFAEDAKAAKKDMTAGHVLYGQINVALVMFANDDDDFIDLDQAVNRLLVSSNMVFHQFPWNMVDAWLGTLPGHRFANAVRTVCSTMNLAHMVPLTAVWTGKPTNDHFGTRSLLWLTTHGTLPFMLDLYHYDVGHTKIIGPTGTGKSTLVDRLHAAYTRIPNARVFRFEIGRAGTVLTRAMGGRIYDFAGGVALQPLRRIDTPTQFGARLEWLYTLLRLQNITINTAVRADVTKALRLLTGNEPKRRTLTHFATYLDSHELQRAIELFCHGPDNAYGHLFDGDEEAIELSASTLFELGGLIEQSEVATLAQMHLLNLIDEETLSGLPTLLILDEGWRFLLDTQWLKELNKWLRTMRKRNVAVVFATQSMADLKASEISILASDSFVTSIYMPNEEALTDENIALYQSLGLNRAETGIIADMQRQLEGYFAGKSGKRRFAMHLGPIGRALCGRSRAETDLVLSDRIAEITGDDGVQYLRCWLHAVTDPAEAERAAGPMDAYVADVLTAALPLAA